MPADAPTPKYLEIVNAVRDRIDRGRYPVGTLLPSEAQLSGEFSASRSTVVKALELLRQDGYLQGEQGRGRVVLRRTRLTYPPAPDRITRLLRPETSAALTLASVQRVRLGRRLASAMTLPVGTTVVQRRRLVAVDGSSPVMLSTAYVPAALAVGTDAGRTVPLAEGLLAHLRQRRTLVPRRVVEHVSARQPSTEEATQLRIDRHTCTVVVLLVVLDASDRCMVAVETVVSPAYDGLSATFSLT